jgi:regulator of Ty1 transposition protein 103
MSFSEASLLKKINELNNTQQSVQSVSLWLIHHRKHSHTIVKIWLKELINSTKSERKLTFIYLANDMLQNSRKKGYEYMTEFAAVLGDAIENTAKYSDEKVRFTLERILNIWKDRKIYPDEKIEELKKILHTTKATEILNSPPIADEVEEKKSETGKKSISKITVTKLNNKHKLEDNKSDANLMKKKFITDGAAMSNDTSSKIDPNNPKTHFSLREEVAKELAQSGNSIQPPDSNELVNLLQDLEKSASSDAVVREKIAELPQKLSDMNEIQNVKDKTEALELSKTVTDAITLLDSYNARLSQESISRKQTALLLAAFIRQQNNEIENDEKLLDDWKKKLKQVENVKQELQTHLESLPDLRSIEEIASITPLPSAGDLFSS